MDQFAEQMFKLELTKKQKFAKYSLLVFGIVILCLVVLMAMTGWIFFYPLAVIGVIGLVYLMSFFNMELEYSFTNDIFDIDCITAKRSRKRWLSVDCTKVIEFGKFTGAESALCSNTLYAANMDSENLYYFITQIPSKGKCLIVIQPDEQMLEVLKKSTRTRV